MILSRNFLRPPFDFDLTGHNKTGLIKFNVYKWKLVNHFSAFFALPLLGLLTNWSFFLNSSFNANKYAQYPNLKKSFCVQRFEIVLNGYFFVLKKETLSKTYHQEFLKSVEITECQRE
ncbi:hypothetical protein BpHYR1_046762 [Brachionus plicatilis]|uniref:Uncharacterized protein n=1 Tax=Brachionus plicatilis TaxID=10195 RepID=A0A3M7SDW6_BRAPC|nr:hypothetical protein BpHYR1_046762 [Brachionus plicatilis]